MAKRINDFSNYFSYSFSLDCLIFGFKDEQIHVLLIERNTDPFKGHWAIPGDLIKPDEDLQDAAERILYDLTSIKSVELHQSQTFGKPNRHPEGRVITCAYFALVNIDDLEINASSWASKIKWHPVKKIEGLAFDHDEILGSTFEILKQKLSIEPVCFDLLPEKFSLHEMQRLYEYAFNTELDKANFRKKIKHIPLEKQKERQKNVRHRPAALFSFDKETYKELTDNHEYIFKM